MTQSDWLRIKAARLGVPSIACLRSRYWREDAAALAARYGLPADLHPLQVRALVALAAGPRSPESLARACGVNAARGYRAFNADRVNLLSDLARRGLVAKVQESRGWRAGRVPAVYLLTAAAMDMLGAAA